jgi:hypothetical protein
VQRRTAETLLTEVIAPLDSSTAALVKARIRSEKLVELTQEAAVNVAQRHAPDDTLSEGIVGELRRLVLRELDTVSTRSRWRLFRRRLPT